MPVKSTLLAVLACPSEDHAPLRPSTRDGVETLLCTFCATRFPIENGIPVLLLDDATPGPNGIGVAAPADAFDGEDPSTPEPEPAVAPEPEPEAPQGPVSQGPVPPGPITVDAILDPSVRVDPSLSPRHALPEPEDAQPTPTPTPGPDAAGSAAGEPGSRSLVDGLRGRVQQRLADLEASRGPRTRRRGGR